MRIVDRKTFLALPAGTVFSKYQPHCFDEPRIKGETSCDIDFWYSDLTSMEVGDGDEWIEAHERAIKGEPVPMDIDTETRDGLFDDDQLFGVWERSDIERLIVKLATCALMMPEEKKSEPHVELAMLMMTAEPHD